MSDAGIDLSFGPDTVKPSEYTPLDEGVYTLLCSAATVKKTQAGELMIVLEYTVTEGQGVREGSERKVRDNWVIPGAERKANEPDKWNMMMNMLRDRLEVLTDTEWRDDDMKLDVNELPGHGCRAILVQEAYDYTKDGERKVGVSNKIGKYLAPGAPEPAAAPTGGSSEGGSGFDL